MALIRPDHTFFFSLSPSSDEGFDFERGAFSLSFASASRENVDDDDSMLQRDALSCDL